jgi:hypothetical protein
LPLNPTSLSTQITTIIGLLTAEADVTAHVRDLITKPEYGINLDPRQIVVDSAVLPDSRRRPDLAIYETLAASPLKQPDHLFAIIEMKKEGVLQTTVDEVWRDKKPYIQPATRYFYIIDQRQLRRYDLETGAVLDWEWDSLRSPEIYIEAFGAISAEQLRFEATLERFRQGSTRFAYLSVEKLGRPAFTRSVSEASNRLSSAIRALVDGPLTTSVNAAQVLVADMATRWGVPSVDWAHAEAPIEFSRILDPAQADQLTPVDIERYEDEYDTFMGQMRPHLDAWRIETELLPSYAQRLGIKEPSLTKSRGTKSKPSETGRAVENLAYETGALILARMLMVRFGEDHGLFEARYISNGGITVFATYANHFRRPLQALLVETNRASAQLFEQLFSPTLLDWALGSDDEALSNEILAAAYLLSRWDFRTVRGDLLSGVYDRYLEPARRRVLGEVYTRPEVARYMLAAAGFAPGKSLLDPACGTGTFLVEALGQELARLRTAGAADDVEALRRVLGRLSGLDLNPFAVVLAQIQVLWHIIELLAGRSASEVRDTCRRLIPAIDIHGGWSSLHPMGLSFGRIASGGGQGTLLMNTQVTERRAAASVVPRGFYRVGRRSYDAVCMNPPYVSAENQTAFAFGDTYDEVGEWQADLYVFFIYRALRQWVKPGGRLAVIVPYAILEADYAAQLRAIMRECRIVEIVDLEGVAKAVFRGVKRVVVILVLERLAEGAQLEDFPVMSSTLGPDAYDEEHDVIDFSRAHRSELPTSALLASTYLPALPDEWSESVRQRSQTAEGAPLVSKLTRADSRVLSHLRDAARLGSIIKKCWRRNKLPLTVLQELPSGVPRAEWRPELMAALGIKVGGLRGLAPSGAPIWKGQNIFPGGVVGEPIAGGFWDPVVSKVPRKGLMGYAHLFEYDRLYAVRDISQLPTACPVPEGAAFQNSAVMVQLAEDFPLDRWLLSRVIQWYSARLLRSTIIEDLGAHWYKKSLVLIPVPRERGAALISAISEAGGDVIQADRDLANRHRHVSEILDGEGASTLRDLIVAASPLTEGLDLGELEAGPAALAGVRIEEDTIVGNDPSLRIRAGSAGLRRILLYHLRRAAEGDTPQLTKGELLDLPIWPASEADQERLLVEIERADERDASHRFENALQVLDGIVGESLGLSPAMVRYCRMAMKYDPVLSKMRPSLLQRGLRVQLYRPDDAPEE